MKETVGLLFFMKWLEGWSWESHCSACILSHNLELDLQRGHFFKESSWPTQETFHFLIGRRREGDVLLLFMVIIISISGLRELHRRGGRNSVRARWDEGPTGPSKSTWSKLM